MTNLWAVDAEICEDMQIVFGLVARHHGRYPDALDPALEPEFKAIIAAWRPEILG